MKNLYFKILIVTSSIIFLVFLGLLINLVAKPLVYNEEYVAIDENSFSEESLIFDRNGIVTLISKHPELESYDIEHYVYERYGELIEIKNFNGGEFPLISVRANLFKISINNTSFGEDRVTIFTCQSGIIAVSIYSVIATLSLAGVITLLIILKKRKK